MKRQEQKVSDKPKTKYHKNQKTTQHIIKNKEKKRTLKLPFQMPYVILAIMLWIFSSFIYGDVFYIAEQNIYFAFDKTIMFYVLEMKEAPLIIIGRLLLLPFHYPIVGGLIFAILLTLIAYLIDYIFKLKASTRIIAIALPLIYVAYLVFTGLNLFYQNDASLLFAYPVILFIALLLIALVIRIITKRQMISPWLLGKTDSPHSCLIVYLSEIFLFIALLVYAIPFRVNTRATVKMQRMMENGDWDGMIETALKIDRPSRAVCCYYAIALSQTNQIGTRLFDIHYQYPNMHLVNRTGDPDGSSEYYTGDGDFYAGLINTSYHDCMERTVIDGPRVIILKRMFLCAILNHELFLAHKYMDIISKMPFENSFVERYSPMLHSNEAIKQDPDLMNVAELMPAEDSFEQWYRAPLFIGYNVALTSGRSVRALHNSLAACLYAKELNSFYERTRPLQGMSIPKTFEEGLVLYGLKDVGKIKDFQLSPISLQTAKTFLMDAVEYKGQDRKDVFYHLKHYLGFYPFYYYFENIPDENYVTDKKETGRVN